MPKKIDSVRNEIYYFSAHKRLFPIPKTFNKSIIPRVVYTDNHKTIERLSLQSSTYQVLDYNFSLVMLHKYVTCCW